MKVFGTLALSIALAVTAAAAQILLPPAPSIQLSAEDAARLAQEGRASVNATVAAGLELRLWASANMLADPIAIDFDDRGVAYVTSSPRSGQLLDIRRHADWVPEVHTLQTVDDLRGFFTRTLAPERSGQNPWLTDFNKDGSRDWRDLLVIKDRIYRLEDTYGIGVAAASRVVYEGFNDDVASDIAGGLMVDPFGSGALFVAAAPDLWKLRDTNGDGTFDTKTSISSGYSTHPTLSGHDLSAITMGPDGRIYWKVGEMGFNVVDQTGRRWAYPNQGAVLRANADGSDFEVFAAGLRNTQEIDFDDRGNLIAVDNDGDYPGEQERVVYITYGSDAGWRSNWQYGKFTDPANNTYNAWIAEGLSKPRFDGQAAFIVPPVASYRAGPAGFKFNPGTALDERWRDHFFVTSFTGNPATSRVFAFQLKEQGAGFSLTGDTEVLRGVSSPGLTFGPDGALYLTDGHNGFVSKGTGRVWALDTASSFPSGIRSEVKALLRLDLAARSAGELRAMLRHQDRRIRQRAQFELVRRRDVFTLSSMLRIDIQPLARIHAVWGLGQLVRRGDAAAGVLEPFLRNGDAEIRAQTAKVLGDVKAVSAASSLVPLLSDTAARVRFFAAEALGRMAYRPAFPSIVQMLAADAETDVYLRHAGSAALASIGDGATVAALAQHSSRGVRLSAVVALRRMRDAGVARFLDDPDERVVVEAARAINDDGGIAGALPALARLLDTTRSTNEALLRRAISANLRIGTTDAAARLATFANSAAPPRAMATEAANALAVWTAPSILDRVDGAYLGAIR